VRERVLEAAEFNGSERLGTTYDCGCAPFGGDVPTARDTAFAKIRARVAGTALAGPRPLIGTVPRDGRPARDPGGARTRSCRRS
jgi:hypothetical protein